MGGVYSAFLSDESFSHLGMPPRHTWAFLGQPPQSRARLGTWLPSSTSRSGPEGPKPARHQEPRPSVGCAREGSSDPDGLRPWPLAAPVSALASCWTPTVRPLVDGQAQPEPSTAKALSQNRNEDASALFSGATWASKTTLVSGDQRPAHSLLPGSEHPGKQ